MAPRLGRDLLPVFSRLPTVRLIQRRSLWVPTWIGWGLLAVVVILPGAAWFFTAESLLSTTHRAKAAEVLIVEGWIGSEAIRSAAIEWSDGDYQQLIATGALTSSRWTDQRWSYAEMARRELVRCGVPEGRIVLAPAEPSDSQRTFHTALAVRRALDGREIAPTAVNVFTLGPHAARSRLIFAKVLGEGTGVGVISWRPPEDGGSKWWSSTERAKDVITETVGFLFEALFDSGRQ